MRLIKENVERIVASKVVVSDMLQHGWEEVKEDAAEEEVKEDAAEEEVKEDAAEEEVKEPKRRKYKTED